MSIEASNHSAESLDSLSADERNSNCNLIVSIRCYLKILMHSLRYPHAIVNGLLVMEKKNKLNKSNRLVDCIPLFHSSHGLTPMLEVALNQISDYLQRNTNYVIGGYYQANDTFHEIPGPSPNIFVERIAEKIHETNSDSVVLMLSDFHLATSIDEAKNLNLPIFMFTFVDGKLKPTSNNRGFQLENNESTYKAIQELIFDKHYHLNIIDLICIWKTLATIGEICD
ncbi:ER membrane protein complex subunit 8 [Sarcoptes scabiei]|uniref:ER membrane protein complex subunit 8 n=1 Tax=Sarcoptes scabiei TaxID=52283 RepID=A0A834RD85_SARSC|nr:ER membrane protein complex subunit 8 [Sarcoptes scabiei]